MPRPAIALPAALLLAAAFLAPGAAQANSLSPQSAADSGTALGSDVDRYLASLGLSLPAADPALRSMETGDASPGPEWHGVEAEGEKPASGILGTQVGEDLARQVACLVASSPPEPNSTSFERPSTPLDACLVAAGGHSSDPGRARGREVHVSPQSLPRSLFRPPRPLF